MSQHVESLSGVSRGESVFANSGRGIRRFLADGSAAWNISQRGLIAILAVPPMIALAGAASALGGKDVYKWVIREDGLAEWLQVLFYSGAFLLSLVLVRRLVRRRQVGIALLYLILSAGFFFMIGEELSWGQRAVGWQTPAVFEEINKKAETNLHNIHGVGNTFKWVQLLVGAYGTILPLVVLSSAVPARYRDLLRYVVPHYTLIPYFFFLFAWRCYRNVLDPPDRFYFVVSEYNEVMELILTIGFFLFLVFQLRRLNSDKIATAPRQ